MGGRALLYCGFFLHGIGWGAELAAWAAAALPRVPMPHSTSGHVPDSPVKAARLKEFNLVFMIGWNRAGCVYCALILRTALRILGVLWYPRAQQSLCCRQRGILETWFLWQVLHPWTAHAGAGGAHEEKEVVGRCYGQTTIPQPHPCTTWGGRGRGGKRGFEWNVF